MKEVMGVGRRVRSSKGEMMRILDAHADINPHSYQLHLIPPYKNEGRK